MSEESENENPPWSKLLTVEMKVKAIAYLFENQGSGPITPLPEELNDIHLGLAKIIYGFSEEIANIRNDLESIDIAKAQLEFNKKMAIPRTKSPKKAT